jgi:hypothetical protein
MSSVSSTSGTMIISSDFWASLVPRQRSSTSGSSRNDKKIIEVVVRNLFSMGL